MKSKTIITTYLANAISSHAITVRELCASLGITTRANEKAGDLFDRLVDAYLEQTWRYAA